MQENPNEVETTPNEVETTKPEEVNNTKKPVVKAKAKQLILNVVKATVAGYPQTRTINGREKVVVCAIITTPVGSNHHNEGGVYELTKPQAERIAEESVGVKDIRVMVAAVRSAKGSATLIVDEEFHQVGEEWSSKDGKRVGKYGFDLMPDGKLVAKAIQTNWYEGKNHTLSFGEDGLSIAQQIEILQLAKAYGAIPMKGFTQQVAASAPNVDALPE